jgi:hypothetical protein
MFLVIFQVFPPFYCSIKHSEMKFKIYLPVHKIHHYYYTVLQSFTKFSSTISFLMHYYGSCKYYWPSLFYLFNNQNKQIVYSYPSLYINLIIAVSLIHGWPPNNTVNTTFLWLFSHDAFSWTSHSSSAFSLCELFYDLSQPEPHCWLRNVLQISAYIFTNTEVKGKRERLHHPCA